MATDRRPLYATLIFLGILLTRAGAALDVQLAGALGPRSCSPAPGAPDDLEGTDLSLDR